MLIYSIFSFNNMECYKCRTKRIRQFKDKSSMDDYFCHPFYRFYYLFNIWIQKREKIGYSTVRNGNEIKKHLTNHYFFYTTCASFNKWSHRLAVRTLASHAGNRGSIPRGITKNKIKEL